MEQNNELEELAAEAMEQRSEGVKSEPATPGVLSDIVAALQEEDGDAAPDEDPEPAQLVKSIEWLRSKHMSAEDIVDFIKYVCEKK